MTPEEINRKLAEWAGIDGTEYFGRYGRSFDKAGYPPDYFHTKAAMDLLGVLTKEHGYWYEMTSHADGTHTVIIGKWVDDAWEDGTSAWIRKYICESGRQPTIPAAICTAIIELIEREGRL